MIKETHKVLMVNTENRISVGNDAIGVTVEHQICLYTKDDGGIGVDVDFMDIRDIEFMGMPLEDQSYKGFRKFKEQMLELGVDVDKLIDEECVGLFSNEDLAFIKNKYRNLFS